MASSKENRGDKLTLAKLASYDDILTDALVDRAFFWSKIRKNRNKYMAARGISEDDVTKILLHDVIVGKDLPKAESALLKMTGLKKFVEKLGSDRERDWFRRHMRKYIAMYLPDCAFEVATTNRYTVTTHEAAVSARKYIPVGKTIKYLTGTLVPITREEEIDLDLTRRDFSIVMSSRKKTPSLFLGPARFANHDCNANGRLVMRGSEGMEVVATRDIDIGEEITVTYGDNYFGIDNCECLCHTCEYLVQNGWAPIPPTDDEEEQGEEVKETEQIEEIEEEEEEEEDDDAVVLVQTDPELDDDQSDVRASQPRCKRRKLQREPSGLRREITPPSSAPAASSTLELPKQNDQLEKQFLSSSTTAENIDASGNLKPQIFPLDGGDDVSNAVATPNTTTTSSAPTEDGSYFSSAGSSTGGQASTPATSVSDPTARTTSVSPEQNSACHHESPEKTSKIPDPPKLPDIQLSDPDDGDLSDLSNSWEMDDTKMSLVKRDPSTPQQNNRRKRKRHIFISVEPEPAPVARVPGDYTKTPRLLAQRYDRWVDCQTCFAWFVQSDAYQTRKECPRCERHSKLYGYRWPKTDKEGRNDTEERIMDHRTIHRFLSTDAETRVQRRGRGTTRSQGGDYLTPDLSEFKTEAPSTTDASEAGDPRRVTRARRRSARESLASW